MSLDVFTAGTNPGGLTSSIEIKALLCYLISKYDYPIPQEVIMTSLTFSGIANYFDCSAAFTELLDSKVLIASEEGYSLSSSGYFVSENIYTKVPIAIREKAVISIRQNMLLYRYSKQHITSIEKIEDGYIVHCHIGGADSQFFSMSLYAPSRAIADTIKDNFVLNASSIIDSIIQHMTVIQ